MTGAVHVACANDEQHRFAVSPAHLNRHLRFGRQVDIVTFHSLQSVFAYAIEESRGRAMIKNFWRCLRWVLQIYFDRMPLVRADTLAILAEREALLVARRNDVLE